MDASATQNDVHHEGTKGTKKGKKVVEIRACHEQLSAHAFGNTIALVSFVSFVPSW